MYYKHNLDYKYPDRSDEHMITVEHLRDVNVDANYPYLDKSFRFKVIRSLYWLAVTTVVFPVMRFSHGLKIYGKENYKKHKDEYKNGGITVSNHVFYWDYLCVLKAIRPHLAYFPAWKTNLEGSNGPLIRMSGGIPIPDDSIRSMIKFKGAIEELIESGKWLHFYPEGSMWLFYPDIRPFKKAVFTYAVKYDKPVLPITMSFRPRRGILRLFSKKPAVDMHIGEPLYADKTLDPRAAAEDLRARTYHIMQVMNGINPGDTNYNTDQNVDHYQKTM